MLRLPPRLWSCWTACNVACRECTCGRCSDLAPSWGGVGSNAVASLGTAFGVWTHESALTRGPMGEYVAFMSYSDPPTRPVCTTCGLTGATNASCPEPGTTAPWSSQGSGAPPKLGISSRDPTFMSWIACVHPSLVHRSVCEVHRLCACGSHDWCGGCLGGGVGASAC